MKVILYTTHCPACAAMVRLLKDNNVEYTECSDIPTMQKKGFTHVPWIEFEDGTLYDLKGAIAHFRSNK